jgi:hypothetical protein
MGEVDHAHAPEDQREAAGQQEEEGAAGELDVHSRDVMVIPFPV